MSRFIFFAVPSALLALLALAFISIDDAGAQKRPSFEKVDYAALTKAPLSGDFIMGNKGARVTIVEYASLSCPHCAHFHKDVLPELKKKYIDTGKALYILRQFPINEPALKGALLVDCVGQESGADRYYTFVNVLFNAQNKWAFDPNFLASLETFAKVGGVSKEKFDACMVDSTRELKLLKVKQEATDTLKVNHTPYFFINAHRYDDDVTVERMSAYIDSQLPK